MAPIKFEENIKDKLEKRTLSPSADSWSKLSERLDAGEKKSKNPIFWWLSIAAGLIIMLAVTVQFFNKGQVEDTIPVMVEEQVKEEQLEIKVQTINNEEIIELATEENNIGTQNENISNPQKSQIIDYKEFTKTASKNKSRLAENSESNKEKIESKNSPNEESILIDEFHLKAVVTKVLNKSKSENTNVSNREIDSLLKLASKELFKEKVQDESTKTVDANALLMSVEDEIGQSFRTKVFEALKESYETVKTAVAERNN